MITIYTVWCEYDMGWNVDDNFGIFYNETNMYNYLRSRDWDSLDLESYQDALDSGLLEIVEMEIE